MHAVVVVPVCAMQVHERDRLTDFLVREPSPSPRLCVACLYGMLDAWTCGGFRVFLATLFLCYPRTDHCDSRRAAAPARPESRAHERCAQSLVFSRFVRVGSCDTCKRYPSLMWRLVALPVCLLQVSSSPVSCSHSHSFSSDGSFAATLNAPMFSQYFGGCPVIEIKARCVLLLVVALLRVRCVQNRLATVISCVRDASLVVLHLAAAHVC